MKKTHAWFHPFTTATPPICYLDADCGGEDCDKGILHHVLLQGGRGAGILAMEAVEIVAVDTVAAVSVVVEGRAARGDV